MLRVKAVAIFSLSCKGMLIIIELFISDVPKDWGKDSTRKGSGPEARAQSHIA